jgi:IS30 family transposase
MPLIPMHKEIKVRALLKESLSLREIAKKVGVGRSTVRRIKRAPGLRIRTPRLTHRLRTPKRCELCGAECP